MIRKDQRILLNKENQIILFIKTLGDWIIPKKYRKDILNYLERASINEVPYFMYGITTCIIFIISSIVSIIILNRDTFSNMPLFISFFLFFIIIISVFLTFTLIFTISYRFYLNAKIDYKIRKMEEVFPEFLSELSLNLKSGQGLEEALNNSVEEEYGYLSEEIERICKKVRLGVDVELAIKEFTTNFDSEVMEETFDLIVTGWKKGTAISQLVDRIVENLEVIRFLRRKIIASVTSYRMFLSLVTIIIAPAMFAISYYLINLIRTMTGKISAMSSNVVLPITITAVRVNTDHFQLFSILALIVMSVCTAMIISIIKTGAVKEGYKQMLIFGIASFISYKIAMVIFSYFFAMFNI
jgi:archaellum biogenesis protein FlaJ (TadC family)